MEQIAQSPTEDSFVQDPYSFYERARAIDDIVWWKDYELPVAVSHAAVSAVLRDRRMGREIPPEQRTDPAPHVAPFDQIEAHSMLELEPPRHTRLRGLVLRAFTSRRIQGLAPEISKIAEDLIGGFPDGPFDLLPHFAQHLPVIVIARLLGVPESMSGQLLTWSNAMVSMYQARRTRAIEERAGQAAREFSDFLRVYIEERRSRPADDLITHLIAAREDGAKLSTDELISTAILLLNAGHEATVHTIGNGVRTILLTEMDLRALQPAFVEATVEEVLRYDPPLHLFTRHVYEPVEMFGHSFRRGDEIGVLLAAANRDPGIWEDAGRFDPTRPPKTHMSFGAGIHFCLGAPLARLELQIALPLLFANCPGLHLTEPPRYGSIYHFHGQERLMVACGGRAARAAASSST